MNTKMISLKLCKCKTTGAKGAV